MAAAQQYAAEDRYAESRVPGVACVCLRIACAHLT
jgi:hypothetical protein